MNTEHNNMGVAPPNYMALAVIATILGCCSTLGIGFILGVVAIYFASQVKSKYNSGDLEGAQKNSKYAKILSFIAIGLMVINLAYGAYMYTAHPEVYEQQMEEIMRMMEQYEEQSVQ